LPEFDVSVVTTRSGTWTLRVAAGSATDALRLVEAECAAGECHCPPEACTDDLYSSVIGVRQVASRDAVAMHASQAGSEQPSHG
jgi:hypothetical protein